MVMSLTFFGGFRAGELCLMDTVQFDPSQHLTAGDIMINTQASHIHIYLKHSKTDLLNAGIQNRIGCSGHKIYTFCLMCNYMQHHPDPRIDNPLFLDSHNNVLRKHYFYVYWLLQVFIPVDIRVIVLEQAVPHQEQMLDSQNGS